MNTKSQITEDIQSFWGALYHSLYYESDKKLTRKGMLSAIDDLEDMFRYREHMSCVEMPLLSLKSKHVLEIGSGAGGHSALFAKYGARMTSVDLTFARTLSTRNKFRLLGSLANSCEALQTDAEYLPFDDNTFDIVYSNGVLHHASDTVGCVSEVYRVLKPGGKIVIMLYSKHSWHYWFNMVLCVGLLKGKLFTGKNWLGRATEWGGKDSQMVLNPITRCYSSNQLKRLFSDFNNITLRKRGFYFRLIPKIGRWLLKYQRARYGDHPGGILVYGEPWPIQSPLELRLGKYLGWAWFISAIKPQ